MRPADCPGLDIVEKTSREQVLGAEGGECNEKPCTTVCWLPRRLKDSSGVPRYGKG